MNDLKNEPFKAALKNYQNGNRLLAKNICLNVQDTSTDFSNAQYLLGLIAQDEGDHQAAVALLARASEIHPQNSQIHFQLAISSNCLGLTEEAVGFYLKALAINPEMPEALCNLGNLYQKSNQIHKAIDCYQRALRLNPLIAQVHYNLGVCYQANFQPEKAIPCFRSVLSLDKDHAVALNNLGVSLSELGMIGEAISCLRKAQKINPTYSDPLFNLHAILLNPEDLSESITCLEKALKIEPDNESYQFFLGLLYDYRGESANAQKYLNQETGSLTYQADNAAWRYIKNTGKPPPVIHGHPSQVLKYALQHAVVQGLILEFGVFNGKSIRMIADLVDGPVHGFDSFEGIPEDWNHEVSGSYSTQHVFPDVPANVVLHPGWFNDSIPEFIKKEPGPIRLMNIDCDLYSSTKTVLTLLASQIVAGTVIVFDEYIGNPTWAEDEHKALHEAATEFNWAYKLLNFSFVTKQLVVLVESVAAFI